MKKWNMLAALLVLTVFIGFAQADDTAPKSTLNDKCPISGEDINAEQTSDYTVEFCCNKCKAKFDDSPGLYMEKAAEGEEGKCIFNGKPAKASTTLTIGFCCGNCKAKFDKEPKKYIGKVKPSAPTEE